ncbi:uncharacterized protein LOC128762935 isoform X2 [Synchiropus splendidus]|uniref:uncharacterized protein LOC128762935 isoform X2 n=1 Tax=Synchiropus splendidus TaxID=270530 RepID=UPI00237E397E|nr:uncharacterized protein LOC128762935 isoform X2 [Synchiropus splendidus]
MRRFKPWFHTELQVPSVKAPHHEPEPKILTARTLDYHPLSVDSSFHEYYHPQKPKMKNYQSASKMTSSHPPFIRNHRAGSGLQSPMHQSQPLYDAPSYHPDVPYNHPPVLTWPPSNKTLSGNEVSMYNARSMLFLFKPPLNEISIEPIPKGDFSTSKLQSELNEEISLLPKSPRYHLSQQPDGGPELDSQEYRFMIQPENQILHHPFRPKSQSHDTGPLLRTYVATQDPHLAPLWVPGLQPEIQNHHLQYEESVYKHRQPWNHGQKNKGNPQAPRYEHPIWPRASTHQSLPSYPDNVPVSFVPVSVFLTWWVVY